MDKSGVLTIDKWAQGTAQYPLAGFARMQNVETQENPGIVKLTDRQIADPSLTLSALALAREVDDQGNIYTLTGEFAQGHVYKNGTSITPSPLANMWDIKIFKNYLWIRHDKFLSAYGPLDSDPQLFLYILDTFAEFYYGKLLAGQDNYLYSGNGNFVARLDPLGLALSTATISYTSETALFDVGESISNGTGGVATVVSDDGVANLVVENVTGTFSVGDSIVGATSGSVLVATAVSVVSPSAPTFDQSPVFNSGGVQIAGFTALQGLALPDREYCTTMVELGENIEVGTSGGVSFQDRVNFPTARIYPWNRQLGTLGNPGTANLPVIFKENGLHAMISYANNLYVVAGIFGNVYKSDGVNYVKIARLPWKNIGVGGTMQVYPNAIDISYSGKLLIGSSTSSGDVVPNTTSHHGVWEINLDITQSSKDQPAYPVTLKKTISTGGYGQDKELFIGFVDSQSFQDVNIGWAEFDGTDYTYGCDIGDFVMYNGFSGAVESALFQVGTRLQPKSFKQMDFYLAEPLVDGQRIRFSFRKNTSDDYQEIFTWGFADETGVVGLGGVTCHADASFITDTQYVQIMVELDQDPDVEYGSNVNLIMARFF